MVQDVPSLRSGVNPIHWTVGRAKLEFRSGNFWLNRFLRLLSRFPVQLVLDRISGKKRPPYLPYNARSRTS